MKDAGFDNHKVCAVTGHQNQASIENYDRLDCNGSNRLSEMAAHMLEQRTLGSMIEPAAKRSKTTEGNTAVIVMTSTLKGAPRDCSVLLQATQHLTT